jgi:hypothetical protein
VKSPNPFDPAQNSNYGPRLSFDVRKESTTVLDSTKAFIRRFVSLSESQARVAAVWVVHTHVIDSADATPYLAITSAEKQSGKTRLLEVLETLVASPWLTGRVTAAVLIRKIDEERPTLLLDESDAAFGGEETYAEALRGVLNTGHKPSGKASCCVGQGTKMGYKDFSTFCPKAVAGIGKLPDTIADRAIPVRLKRATRGEFIERFRRRDIEIEAGQLKGQIEAWCQIILDGLRDVRPELPDELTDRQQDGAEPLLAIADAAGGDWPQALRSALIDLCTQAQAADGSIGVQLLGDIRQIIGARADDRISSADLAAALCEIETFPWAEWSHGKPMTAGKLARLLGRYDIVPRTIRLVEKTAKGYLRDDFADAWSRYLPTTSPQKVTAVTSSIFNNLERKQNVTEGMGVTDQKCEIANTGAGCDGATFLDPQEGEWPCREQEEDEALRVQ